MREKRRTAIILAGGRGKRMKTAVSKQYLEIGGKPLLYYSLYTFERSQVIDDIILVVGKGQTDYARENILKPFGFRKIGRIIEGGKERFDSVWEGLKLIEKREMTAPGAEGYIFIHDSARPFVNEEILERGLAGAEKFGACVTAVLSKDTVKLADKEGFVAATPDRERVWIVQTPQVFEAGLIIKAYSEMMKGERIRATDDAAAVEQTLGVPVKFIEGAYENIKITTPQDLEIGEILAEKYLRRNP